MVTSRVSNKFPFFPGHISDTTWLTFLLPAFFSRGVMKVFLKIKFKWLLKGLHHIYVFVNCFEGEKNIITMHAFCTRNHSLACTKAAIKVVSLINMIELEISMRLKILFLNIYLRSYHFIWLRCSPSILFLS